MTARMPWTKIGEALAVFVVGILLMVLPIKLHLGDISGWLVGLPCVAGAVVLINAFSLFGELPIRISPLALRWAGAVTAATGIALYVATRHPDLVSPWQVVGGALFVFGLYLAGTASLSKASSYWILTLLAGILICPFVWMVFVSLQPPKTPIPTNLSELVPKNPSWSNFDLVLNSPTLPVRRFFFNTVFVTFTTVILQLLITSMAAYGLSRLRFKGREVVFALFLGSMMFAGPVTQIPVYLMLKSFGWLDSYMALIVPGVSSSFSVFLLRQFFLQIPFELDEAARIDGAGDWKIYSRVILPLSKPALATAAAFSFFGVWTDFFGPLIYTNSTEMRTLEVGLSIFKGSYGNNNWPIQMTAALIVLAPLLIVFMFVQRYFVRGIMLGSIK